jgi:hypothetical protein
MLLFRNSYLGRLYRASKPLFVIAVVFISLNIAVNFFGKGELTPFFKWDLYTMPVPVQQQYSFLEVTYNDDSTLIFPHTWREPEKLFFTNTMDLFIWMKNNNNEDPFKNYYENNWRPKHKLLQNVFSVIKILNDSVEVSKFPRWYKKYLSQHIHEPVSNIKVFRKTVEYGSNGALREISSQLIYTLQ